MRPAVFLSRGGSDCPCGLYAVVRSAILSAEPVQRSLGLAVASSEIDPMKRCAVLFLLALFAACSSTDDVPDARDRGSYGRPPMRRASDDGGLDLAPPADWWRDPRL